MVFGRGGIFYLQGHFFKEGIVGYNIHNEIK